MCIEIHSPEHCRVHGDTGSRRRTYTYRKGCGGNCEIDDITTVLAGDPVSTLHCLACTVKTSEQAYRDRLEAERLQRQAEELEKRQERLGGLTAAERGYETDSDDVEYDSGGSRISEAHPSDSEWEDVATEDAFDDNDDDDDDDDEEYHPPPDEYLEYQPDDGYWRYTPSDDRHKHYRRYFRDFCRDVGDDGPDTTSRKAISRGVGKVKGEREQGLCCPRGFVGRP